jgi:hypothetical protein
MGPLFSMFGVIRLCLGVKFFFWETNEIVGFGDLNLFS